MDCSLSFKLAVHELFGCHTIILLVYVVAIKQNAGINLSIRCYGTGALAYIFYYVIAFTGAILWTILFSKLPGNKGLQFIGKHGVT